MKISCTVFLEDFLHLGILISLKTKSFYVGFGFFELHFDFGEIKK
jgi:hypothetical protein